MTDQVTGEVTNIVLLGDFEISQKIVSDELLELFTLVNNVILTFTISSLGVVFNVINIVVFVKQGFNDTINVSLLGLAVADTGAVLTLIWMSICYNPLVVRTYTHINFQDIQHLTAGWPHLCFTRITSWITAYVTLERFLCVALPLRVKMILTPRRTVVIIVFIFLLMIISVFPVLIGVGLNPVFDCRTNQTRVSLDYTPFGEVAENISSSFGVFAQLISFAVVMICTFGLVYELRQKSKWRSSVSNTWSTGSATLTTRDKSVVKMVILIASIFMVTFLATVVILLAMVTVTEFSVTGRYRNLFITSGAFSFPLKGINSTVNIFIYLKMSSKYKETFAKLITCPTPKRRQSTKMTLN